MGGRASDTTEDSPTGTPRRHGWFRRWLERRDLLGMALGALFFWASLTPSLLPRTWVAQGLVSGASFALGYLLGHLVHRALAALGWWSDRLDGWRYVGGWVLLAALPVELVLSLRYRSHDFAALGYDTAERFLYSGVLLVAATVVAVLAVVAWCVRWLFRATQRHAGRRLPWVVATTLATAVCVFVVLISTNELVHRRFIASANDALSWRDTNLTDDDPDPPTSRLRTAGPGSPVTWSGAGYQGRRFLSRGPDAAAIEAASGEPAADPIRAYVGLGNADGLDDAARLAVEELDRTGAFDRAVLLLATPTGTGWVNEQYVQPVEYLEHGDVATVALQYSHLPSGFALFDDRWGAVESTRALRDAVDARLDDLPSADRPRIYVAGESLGSFGGGGIYEDLDEMVEQVDGGVWVGPPPFNERRREAERRRDSGSLQIHPRIAALPELAFGQDRPAFDRDGVRIAFLQNADDPFMWWDPSLALRRPDWLEEPLDARLNPDLRWFPLVTSFQIGADLVVGNSFQEGQGHLYGTLPLDAWRSIIDPHGWSDAEVERLRDHLETVER